jgi:hypothetical protein
MTSMITKRFFLAPSEDLVQLSDQFRLVKETLRRNGSFLPATPDEPPEEIQPYDPDRTDDDSNFDLKNLCDPIEDLTDSKEPYVDPGSALLRTERNFFKFFLDGSIRTYYLGEQIEGGSYPLIATEVASAAIKRADDGRASVSKLLRKIALLIPPSPPVRPQTVRDLLDLRANFSTVRAPVKLDIEQLEREAHKPGVDLRTSLLGKARAIMHDIEHTLAMSLGRAKGDWLVLDGAIRKHEFLGLEETIGLAKSFSRNPVFRISGRVKDVVAMLSGLKEGERTIVFKHSREGEGDPVKKEVAFWYLRLRSGRGLQGPLQGIVKIDYRFRRDHLEADDKDLVNTISRALLAEKYVSPYPTPRWHAHIYPIYVAENYIKSNLFSPLAFRGHFGGI